MGITELITRKEVKENLDRIIPHYERAQRIPIRVAAGRGRASLTGTAFDYALRFELQRRYAITKEHGWIAERALTRIVADNLGDIAQCVRRCVRDARRFVRKHVHRVRPDRAWMTRLAEHALRLARIDAIFRAGYIGDALFEEDRPEQVNEVVELLGCVPFEAFAEPGDDVVLKPAFGRYAAILGGGEVDVIAAGRLIDIRVTAEPKVERSMVRKLVTYLVLAHRARQDGAEVPAIEHMGLYFARHGHLWTLPASLVLDHPDYPEVERRLLYYAEQDGKRL